MRQRAVEVGDHVGQPLAGQIIGGARAEVRAGPDRGHDHHPVLDVVEDRHHRRPDEDRVGNPEPVGIGRRQPLHQPHHVVAHEAEQPGRHWRQRLGERDPRFADQLAELGERAAGQGLERVQVVAGRAVDLGALAEAAPDQVGLEADRGVATAHGAPLDRLEQEAVGPALGQLEHRRDRGLEVGDQRGPDDLRLAVVVAGGELGRVGAGRHLRSERARVRQPRSRSARRLAVGADQPVDRGAIDLDPVVAP